MARQSVMSRRPRPRSCSKKIDDSSDGRVSRSSACECGARPCPGVCGCSAGGRDLSSFGDAGPMPFRERRMPGLQAHPAGRNCRMLISRDRLQRGAVDLHGATGDPGRPGSEPGRAPAIVSVSKNRCAIFIRNRASPIHPLSPGRWGASNRMGRGQAARAILPIRSVSHVGDRRPRSIEANSGRSGPWPGSDFLSLS